MQDAWWLVGLAFAVLLAVLVAYSMRSYRRARRKAEARSRAALNQLLFEADQLAQSRRDDLDPDGDDDQPR